MNETPGLLAKSATFLWKHPVVWLPVLVARAADFLIGFGFNYARGPAVMAVAPHSVLGGVVSKANPAVVTVAALFAVVPMLFEVALFVYAMVVCARWSNAIREGNEPQVRSWGASAGKLLQVAALTFAVSAVTVGVGTYFTLRGGVPLQWIAMVTGCFFVMSSWFLVPVWLRLIAQEQGSRERNLSRGPAFVAFVLGVLGVAAVGYLGTLLQRKFFPVPKPQDAVLLFLLGFGMACLSSLPLAFSFVTMSRYAADRPGWQSEWSGDAA